LTWRYAEILFLLDCLPAVRKKSVKATNMTIRDKVALSDLMVKIVCLVDREKQQP